ncbi:MAG TPA: hypothetical protein VEP30_01185 [Chthoniobacterales bacterium]|nr:hypothetical protein [Chthoniobacterales bacterium]
MKKLITAICGALLATATASFAQDTSQRANTVDSKQAIKVLDDLVSGMDKTIADAQSHKQQLLELRTALVEGKTSKQTFGSGEQLSGQDVGWLVEHPAQAIGKVYDSYKSAEKAVAENNRSNEQWLSKQKEAKTQQETKKK